MAWLWMRLVAMIVFSSFYKKLQQKKELENENN